MHSHTFKVLLTIWFGIGVVTAVFGQLFNVYMVHTGRVDRATLNTTWLINSFFIYGIWHWL